MQHLDLQHLYRQVQYNTRYVLLTVIKGHVSKANCTLSDYRDPENSWRWIGPSDQFGYYIAYTIS